MWSRQTVRHAAEVWSPAQKELTYVREEGTWMAASTFTTDSEGKWGRKRGRTRRSDADTFGSDR